jgi:hypothetical protein
VNEAEIVWDPEAGGETLWLIASPSLQLFQL